MIFLKEDTVSPKKKKISQKKKAGKPSRARDKSANKPELPPHFCVAPDPLTGEYVVEHLLIDVDERESFEQREDAILRAWDLFQEMDPEWYTAICPKKIAGPKPSKKNPWRPVTASDVTKLRLTGRDAAIWLGRRSFSEHAPKTPYEPQFYLWIGNWGPVLGFPRQFCRMARLSA